MHGMRDLQLLHVIAPGENLDYSLEKSESTIMRESLSLTAYGSWVCMHRIVKKEKRKIEEECFRMWVYLEGGQGRRGK